MPVTNYRELIAWQKAMDLVVEVYKLSRAFPPEELYALTNQLRRAAVSVPSNIAEGQGRGVGSDFARFLRISVGSVQEAQTQMLVAERLQYVRHEDVAPVLALSEEVARVTRGLLASVSPN